MLESRSCSLIGGQIAQRLDAGPLEAIAAAGRKLEIANRDPHHLLQLALMPGGILVVVHVARGFDVLEVQLGPLVVRMELQHAAEAEGGRRIILVVLVQQAQVDQRTDVKRRPRQGLLVKPNRVVVVAQQIHLVGEAEQGRRVVRIHVDGPLEILDGAEDVAVIGPDAAHLVRIFGACGPFAGRLPQQAFGFFELARQPDGSGLAEPALNRVVALLGRFSKASTASA